MREMKFSAWNVEEKEMHRNCFNINGLGALPEVYSETMMGTNIIWIQHIGKKDKNGVEIYEHDIVLCDGVIGVVEYFTSLLWEGSLTHPGFYCAEWKDCGDLSYHKGFDNCQVIGNIYEHPELLEL